MNQLDRIMEAIGPELPLWLPKWLVRMVLRELLLHFDFIEEEEKDAEF